MRIFVFGVCAFAIALSAASAAEPFGPWVADTSRPGVLRAPGKTDAPSPFTVWLECGEKTGFGASLTSIDISFHARVSTVMAKVADGQAIELDVDQTPDFPALMHIRGIDVLEKALLRDGTLKLRILVAGEADVIETYHFADIRPTAARILQICPPF